VTRGGNVQGEMCRGKGLSPGCCCWSGRLSFTINDVCAQSIYCGHIILCVLCPLYLVCITQSLVQKYTSNYVCNVLLQTNEVDIRA